MQDSPEVKSVHFSKGTIKRSNHQLQCPTLKLDKYSTSRIPRYSPGCPNKGNTSKLMPTEEQERFARRAAINLRGLIEGRQPILEKFFTSGGISHPMQSVSKPPRSGTVQRPLTSGAQKGNVNPAPTPNATNHRSPTRVCNRQWSKQACHCSEGPNTPREKAY